MNAYLKLIVIFAVVCAAVISLCSVCFGSIVPGQSAPEFSLIDVGGKRYDSSMLNENLMTILYFFAIDSEPNVEGLLFLDKFKKRYKNTDFNVWAITKASITNVKELQVQNNITIPILVDVHSMVSNLYEVKYIFPTSCVIGPQLKIIDYFQGGGKSIEVLLVKLAERLLQRRETTIAKGISDTIAAENPTFVEAKVVNAYAALQQGDLNAAENIFLGLSKNDKKKSEIIGKEGLSALYAKDGQTEKALKLAQEVETKAPQRGHVNTIKGDILYELGMNKAAEEEYKKAIQKTDTSPFIAAKAYNQLGQLLADKGKYIRARELYDKAVLLDPYNIEATANKGVTFEKEGQLDEAKRSYETALTLAAEVDRAIITMKKANIAFSAPEAMNLSDTDEIVLILDMAKTIEELTRMINFRGKKEGATVSVTNRMGAVLTGSAFIIMPISKEVQVITALNDTEWRWEISPTKSGEHTIHLSLNAYFDVKGHDTAKMIQTFKKTIRIKVTWANMAKTFFQSNWQWFCTSLFIPVAILLWKRRETIKNK